MSWSFEESGWNSNLFYSFHVAGVHVIMLGSYTDFDSYSPQYKWLQNDLQTVNKRTTPWIVVLIHAPWYNSNTAHQGEPESINMKVAMEDLLYQARVDVVFEGHVHAYERFVSINYHIPLVLFIRNKISFDLAHIHKVIDSLRFPFLEISTFKKFINFILVNFLMYENFVYYFIIIEFINSSIFFWWIIHGICFCYLGIFFLVLICFGPTKNSWDDRDFNVKYTQIYFL